MTLLRYWEFCAGGRLQGYSRYIAAELPRKTEQKVRDRVRTLRNAGLLKLPEPRDEADDDVEEPLPEETTAAEEPTAEEPTAGPALDEPPTQPAEETHGCGANSPIDDTTTNYDHLGSYQPDAQRAPEPAEILPPPLAPPDRPAAEQPPTPTHRQPTPTPSPVATIGDIPPVPEVQPAVSNRPFSAEAIQQLCPIGHRIQELGARPGDIQEDLDRLVEELHTALRAAVPENERQRPTNERGTRPARTDRTRRRVTQYARTQDLFKKNPSRLAGLVIEKNLGDLAHELPRVDPPREATVALFEAMWGVERESTLHLPRQDRRPDASVLHVTTREVTAKIRRLRPGGAPGPDGVIKRGITTYPQAAGTLAALFNVILLRGVYPRPWLKNRTSLIPKPGKDVARAENWRPITIAPLIARLFSGVVETRLLQQVTLSERQRGFRPGNGCHINCWVLDEVLRMGKKSQIVGVQLDVSKAFDTVSHAAIAEVLSSHGVPRCLQDVIKKMYTGCTTTLGSLGSTITIRRGVKQGDPLSPLLFNLVLDPLLHQLHTAGDGFTIGNHKLAAMAYADDITLFSDTPEGMERQLNSTSQFLSSVGMSLSAAKCGGFHIQKKGDAWVALPMRLTIQGEPLTVFSASSTFDYLGLTFSIRGGFQNRRRLDILCEAAARVRRLPLKPQQKVALLMQYVVPAFAHRLAIDTPSQNDLDRVDTFLRGEVKKILHLHQCTTDNLLYARKKDGGLGFPHLLFQARLCGLRAASALLVMEDDLMRELGRIGGWPAYVERLANQLGVTYPPTPRDIYISKQRLKSAEHQRWESQKSHGQGVSWFRNDPLGNYWLLNQSVLRPGQFIDALKLRTNTYGTRTAINRATKTGVTICRRCQLKPETQGHVIGECTAGRRARIERHNWIVGKIEEDCLRRGATVAREQEFTIEGERLKPDLVIHSRDRVYIADVTIPYENNLSLSTAALEKAAKYSRLLPTVQREFQATSGKVIPVVIGARGALPTATITALKTLGISDRKVLLDFTIMALRSTIDICRAHLDYG